MSAFELAGVRNLNAVLSRMLVGELPQVAARALYQLAEGIMADSKEIVPVDTGALRASGHVELPVIVGDTVSVTMGYGGPAAPYALTVHEVPASHKPPTQWHYLSTPVLAAAGWFEARLAAAIRDGLGRR